MPEPARKVFLASRNEKKLRELRRILSTYVEGVEVLGLDDVPAYDEPAETEPTFEGNARIKAHAAVRATGLPSLADDSGLCVDALNGMPGVLSARWAGVSKDDGADRADRANNELLLNQLQDVPEDRRGAQFRCAVVFAYPVRDSDATDGAENAENAEIAEAVVHGAMPGQVIRELRGTGGFGYDVVFRPDGFELTSAELPATEKDAISHRGQAIREIAPLVAEVLTGR